VLLHALNDETRPQAVALFNKILNLTHSVTRSPSYRGKWADTHEFVLFPDESEPFALSAPCLREGLGDLGLASGSPSSLGRSTVEKPGS